jgi:iron complex outermembrane recepter protein
VLLSPSRALTCGVAALALAPAFPAIAAETTTTVVDQPVETPGETVAGEAPAEENPGGDIIVTGARSFASVVSDIPADEVLDENAIASYGASNVADLVSALSVQTRGGRARGSGPPVVLVNGRRVSGFGEIRNLPPEAISRVEVFPEEVALDYGFAADQRVINFVLKDQFSAISTEVEAGGASDGGRWGQELEAGLFRIRGRTRLNVSAEYTRFTPLTEAERDIVQASGVPLDGELRTLAGGSDVLTIDGTYGLPITQQIGASLNLRYDLNETRGLLGPQALSPDQPLRSQNKSDTFRAGLSSDGRLGRWRWTLTGNYDRVTGTAANERNVATTVSANGISVDRTRSVSDTAELDFVLSGSPFTLPAGRVRTTFQTGWRDISLETQSERQGVITLADLGRTAFTGSANIDVPIASRSDDVLAFIGDFSVNGRYAIRDVSDFRLLESYTAGFNWSPFERVDLVATWVGEESAPGVTQLGAPRLVTSGRTIFDFSRNETVLADVITGGNPALLAETRRDFRVQANWRPIPDVDLLLTTSYANARSRNTTSEFPLLTPEIEAAFPGRVTRGPDGRITSVDFTPVNFARTEARQIRSGISFARAFGQPQRGPGGPGGPPPGAGRGPGAGGPGAGGPPPGAGRGPGGGGGGGGRGFGGGMFGGPGSGGRWSIAAYHTLRLDDDILIRPGVPVLDLLGGSATGATGGSPRHEIEFDGGWFNKGIGFRFGGVWREGSTVVGGPIAGGGRASDLEFSSTFNVTMRAFVDMNQQASLLRAVPALRNVRVRLLAANLFNDRQEVRDANGVIPLRYQQGFLEPTGRYLELAISKRF